MCNLLWIPESLLTDVLPKWLDDCSLVALASTNKGIRKLYGNLRMRILSRRASASWKVRSSWRATALLWVKQVMNEEFFTDQNTIEKWKVLFCPSCICLLNQQRNAVIFQMAHEELVIKRSVPHYIHQQVGLVFIH